LNLTIDVRTVCVFLAPLFSSFTTVITYLLTSGNPGANPFPSNDIFNKSIKNGSKICHYIYIQQRKKKNVQF
jgi:hypothetical protein